MTILHLDHIAARKIISEQQGAQCTRWFKGYTRPTHAGWYQVKSGDIPNSARYWNGTRWMLCSGSSKKEDVSSFQNWIWRGLKKQSAF
ncbi:hypothetical protein [Undibacterium sp. Tian12W]|uniref:hypothetical protein n=1 Tax=Undibacterium sp. Tian12W TaxID=3413054 RepID=UPI003BF0F003